MTLDCFTDCCMYTLPKTNSNKLERYKFEVAQRSDTDIVIVSVMTLEIFPTLQR